MSLPNSLKTLAIGILFVGLGNVTAKEAEAWQWINPEIYNSGNRVSGIYIDPFTGRVVVRTDRTRVRESFMDPHRTHVDPGSMERVNEIQLDAAGVSWRVKGWRWTSHGEPHGQLRRTRIANTGIPGVDQEENDTVFYSQPYNPNGSAQQNSRTTNRSGASRSSNGRTRNRRMRTTGFRSGSYNPF